MVLKDILGHASSTTYKKSKIREVVLQEFMSITFNLENAVAIYYGPLKH